MPHLAMAWVSSACTACQPSMEAGSQWATQKTCSTAWYSSILPFTTSIFLQVERRQLPPAYFQHRMWAGKSYRHPLRRRDADGFFSSLRLSPSALSAITRDEAKGAHHSSGKKLNRTAHKKSLRRRRTEFIWAKTQKLKVGICCPICSASLFWADSDQPHH